ncbi:MAG: response regulator [candidate division WOR-3 bacterium]|nr:MAG: response regulator [candidate division WOR-3 bacterium]
MSYRILVIDDEEAVRKAFILAFEDTEYIIDTADSGEEGIVLNNKHKYDLIFLDLKMPGMGGIETLSIIRKTDTKTPIYIITAFYQEYAEQLKMVEKRGVDFEVVRKPIDSENLRLIVSGILKTPAGY